MKSKPPDMIYRSPIILANSKKPEVSSMENSGLSIHELSAMIFFDCLPASRLPSFPAVFDYELSAVSYELIKPTSFFYYEL
jgi:hypothetical protein